MIFPFFSVYPENTALTFVASFENAADAVTSLPPIGSGHYARPQIFGQQFEIKTSPKLELELFECRWIR